MLEVLNWRHSLGNLGEWTKPISILQAGELKTARSASISEVIIAWYSLLKGIIIVELYKLHMFLPETRVTPRVTQFPLLWP